MAKNLFEQAGAAGSITRPPSAVEFANDSSGILAALVLGFGRALGETMALAMLIGNSNQISWSLFAPANTLASLLASSFPEAGPIEVQALMYAALVLLLITFLVNVLGLGIQQYTMRKFEGKS